MQQFVALLAEERSSSAIVSESIRNNILLNLATEIIFDISTCKTRCQGGDHIFENLLGCIVNQALGGVILDSVGLHDEALGLVRGIGEITNLLAMFILDPPSYTDWLNASEEERKKRFSPIKVRIAIENMNAIAIPMDEQTYKKLCERYIHVNPLTAPNSHGVNKEKHVGGYWQSYGSAQFEQQLTYIVVQAALLASKMFDRVNMLNKLSSAIQMDGKH